MNNIKSSLSTTEVWYSDVGLVWSTDISIFCCWIYNYYSLTFLIRLYDMPLRST